MNQTATRFTPRRAMGELHFAHALDDGLPEIAERGKWFRGQDRFVEHLPDNSQLYQRAGAAFARNEAVGQANELEEAILPGSPGILKAIRSVAAY